MRARRIEFGAGIAACVLSVLAFAFLVFAPIVPVCSVANGAKLAPRMLPAIVTGARLRLAFGAGSSCWRCWRSRWRAA